jgi:hypothetical protein
MGSGAVCSKPLAHFLESCGVRTLLKDDFGGHFFLDQGSL